MEKDKVQSNDEISNEDLERVNVEPAALSDADLDNVAGGKPLPKTNVVVFVDLAKTTYTVK